MSIRARNIHFSNWTNVIVALANNGITVANEEEARTFLIETNSDANPFYYFVGYIKTTKEIYTHGQFYDCSKYDDSAILQKIEELESTLDTKVDLTVFEELQSEVKENELVTARALTELNEKKADLFDFNAIKAEIEENEKVAAKAFMDLNERKLDKEELNNIDLSNYVDWDTYYNNLNTTNSAINLKANQTTVDSLQTTVNSKANQTDLDTLSAEVDLKANQSDLDTLSESLNTLSAEVEENEDVTAAALTELHENKADKTDLDTKQDVISDLDDIRSGASLGATSVQNETYNTDKTNTDSRISTLEGKTNLSDFTDDLIRGYTKVDHGTSDTTFALTPNVYHVWGEVTSLTLTFDTEVSGFANEYLIQFTSGTTATTLSLPDTVKWANENAISIESGKTYSISILNNLAVFAVFTN